jgi:hypothetical protein
MGDTSPDNNGRYYHFWANIRTGQVACCRVEDLYADNNRGYKLGAVPPDEHCDYYYVVNNYNNADEWWADFLSGRGQLKKQ